MADPRVIDQERALEQLRTSMALVRVQVVAGDLDARVPHCPEWNLRDLVHHLGGIHRWVRDAVLHGRPNAQVQAGPDSRAELLTWYDEGADSLADLLGRVAPDAACWTFGPHPRTVRFWHRRQVHEHLVHAWDAEGSQLAAVPGLPVGTGHTPIDPVLAADGVDEVVRMFFPRQVRLGRTEPLRHTLALRLPDVDEPRERVLTGDGTVPDDDLTPAADAVLTAPAEVAYLLLWGRVGVDDPRVTIEGDRAAALSVLGCGLVP